MGAPGHKLLSEYSQQLATVVEQWLDQHRAATYEPTLGIKDICSEYLQEVIDLRQLLTGIVLYSRIDVPQVESQLFTFLSDYAKGLKRQYLTQEALLHEGPSH